MLTTVYNVVVLFIVKVCNKQNAESLPMPRRRTTGDGTVEPPKFRIGQVQMQWLVMFMVIFFY